MTIISQSLVKAHLSKAIKVRIRHSGFWKRIRTRITSEYYAMAFFTGRTVAVPESREDLSRFYQMTILSLASRSLLEKAAWRNCDMSLSDQK